MIEVWVRLRLQVQDVSLPVATETYTAWRIAEPLASNWTSVHPSGAVMTGTPRADTVATSTSPVCTPAGTDAVMLVPADSAVDAETKVIGPTGSPPSAGVVAVVAADGSDTFPAASAAVTVYE